MNTAAEVTKWMAEAVRVNGAPASMAELPRSDPVRLRLMVTVKAYPTLSLTHSELVCCAGIREDTGEWVRLHPVRYRDLPVQHHSEKYDIIEVDCVRRPPHKDDRPESWTPRMDTLVRVGKIEINRPGDWSDRMARIRPTLLHGFAHLLELHRTEKKSLAAFKPARILGFLMEEEKGEWEGTTVGVGPTGFLRSLPRDIGHSLTRP